MKAKVLIAGLIGFVIANEIAKTKPPTIRYVRKLMGNHNGACIPPFGVFIDQKQMGNSDILTHEMIHWKQYQRKGLIKYYGDYLSQYLKYGYDAMPMELEARANETAYCQQNYTKCVRNGTAKTVYNPNFRM